jgi:hypothetical protein
MLMDGQVIASDKRWLDTSPDRTMPLDHLPSRTRSVIEHSACRLDAIRTSIAQSREALENSRKLLMLIGPPSTIADLFKPSKVDTADHS